MSGKPFLKTSFTIGLLLLCITYTAAGKIIYVDDNAALPGDGASWETAFTYLQDALMFVSSGDEIRVAQGIYKPDDFVLSDRPNLGREETFQLINGVTLKGGYAGFGAPDPNTRDIEAYETILSGDLNDDDVDVNDPADLLHEPTRADNCYNVVTGSDTDETAVLDGFTITGGNANDSAIGMGRGGGMYNENGNPTIINCTISGNNGGGMFNDTGSPTLTNCTISGNNGGGMYNENGNPTITNCTFTKNRTVYSGGGMRNIDHSSPALSACVFRANSTGIYGGGMYNHSNSNPTVINCIFSTNSSGFYGGGICNYNKSSPILINCTLSCNSAGSMGGGMYNTDECSPTLTNCILWGNRDPDGMVESAQIYSGVPLVNYCCIQGLTTIIGGIGNINCDPLYVRNPGPGPDGALGTVDDDFGDLHLRCGSPCLNAGTNDIAPPLPLTDLEGNPRIINGAVDMGAYEGGYQAFNIDNCLVLVPEGASAAFTVALACEPAGPIDVTVSHYSGDAHITIESGEVLTFDPVNFSQPQMVVLAAAQDGDRLEGNATIRISAAGVSFAEVVAWEVENDVPAVLFVDTNATGANNGRNWKTAFNHLQDAMILAGGARWAVDEIRVAKGIYKPDRGDGITPGDRGATFQLISDVILKGGYAGFDKPNPDARDIQLYETILSGDLNGDDSEEAFHEEDDAYIIYPDPNRTENSSHVVTGSDTDQTAVLDGFTITGGNGGYGGGMYCFAGSPTLNDCTFSRNLTDRYGGGMYNRQSNPTLSNCTFYANAVIGLNDGGGGGMYNSRSKTVLVNCTFTQNQVYVDEWELDADGGGMFNKSSSPTLTDCTFSYNLALCSGGMCNYHSSPILTNCTFSSNLAEFTGGGMLNYIKTDKNRPILNNCTFSGNSAGIGGGMHNYIYESRFSPVLNDCIFVGNRAGSGAGMSNYANRSECSPIMTNCIFTANSAIRYDGGAMRNYSASPILTNCIFSGNTARRDGGGIYNHKGCTPELANCTFAGNLAENGNAIACHSYQNRAPSYVKITSSILWDGGDEIWKNDDSEITITYSDVQGSWPGEGNIDADPCFVKQGYWEPNCISGDDYYYCTYDWIDGDYHLLHDSPCIDTGDPNYVAEPNETDLDGKPRIINGRIDMGAYEYSPPVPAEIDIDPNTLNLNSKAKWITAFICLPEEYNVADIDPNSVYLEGKIQAEQLHINEQEQVAIAKFNRDNVQAILDVGEIELTITGQLSDGTAFEGTDTIKVIDKAGKKSSK
jgi:parallel beta-helix repeat protein